MMRQTSVVVGCVATALAAAVLLADPPAAGGALTGMWQLNKHLSQAPKRPQDAHGPRFSGGFGGGMGGRHGEGMGGRYGGQRPEGAEGEEPGGSENRPEGGFDRKGEGGMRRGGEMFAAPETIKIDLDGPEVRIISPDGHVRIITADGKAVERERAFVTVTETARWDTGRLVVTSSTPKGRTITETFALADDGSGRLVHTIAMTRAGSGDSSTARWVYDRTPDPAATAVTPH